MPIGTTIALSAAGGILAAVLAERFLMHRDDDDATSAGVVAATAAPIEAGGKAAAETLEAAQKVEQTKADAQLALATMPASRVLSEAVVDEKCAPLTGALATYAIAVSGSQGKEGSASVNAEEAQQDVSKVLAALVEDPALCAQAPEPAEPVAVEPTE
jgi:hypothetical protein